MLLEGGSRWGSAVVGGQTLFTVFARAMRQKLLAKRTATVEKQKGVAAQFASIACVHRIRS
jgi:hypothetical protein